MTKRLLPNQDLRPQIPPELEPLHHLLRAAWHLCPRPDHHPNARRMVGFQHLRSMAAQLYAHGWRVTEPTE